MGQMLILSFPMALAWMVFSRQTTPQSFFVGYVFGFVVVWLVRANSSFEDEDGKLKPAKLPTQLVAIANYGLGLAIEIFVSGIDVALRVLSPQVNVTPAIYRISTQDPTNNPIVSALSAHGITITPGTLVIDFEEEDGETFMVVHSLDSKIWDEQSQIEGQAVRIHQIKRMLGDE